MNFPLNLLNILLVHDECQGDSTMSIWVDCWHQVPTLSRHQLCVLSADISIVTRLWPGPVPSWFLKEVVHKWFTRCGDFLGKSLFASFGLEKHSLGLQKQLLVHAWTDLVHLVSYIICRLNIHLIIATLPTLAWPCCIIISSSACFQSLGVKFK